MPRPSRRAREPRWRAPAASTIAAASARAYPSDPTGPCSGRLDFAVRFFGAGLGSCLQASHAAFSTIQATEFGKGHADRCAACSGTRQGRHAGLRVDSPADTRARRPVALPYRRSGSPARLTPRQPRAWCAVTALIQGKAGRRSTSGTSAGHQMRGRSCRPYISPRSRRSRRMRAQFGDRQRPVAHDRHGQLAAGDVGSTRRLGRADIGQSSPRGGSLSPGQDDMHADAGSFVVRFDHIGGSRHDVSPPSSARPGAAIHGLSAQRMPAAREDPLWRVGLSMARAEARHAGMRCRESSEVRAGLDAGRPRPSGRAGR